MVLSGFHVNTTMEDEEDYFTINGRSYPDTPPITMKKGETARIRLINIDTMEPHTMHLHGMDFQVIARNGSPLKNPETMQYCPARPWRDRRYRISGSRSWRLDVPLSYSRPYDERRRYVTRGNGRVDYDYKSNGVIGACLFMMCNHKKMPPKQSPGRRLWGHFIWISNEGWVYLEACSSHCSISPAFMGIP